MTVLIRQTVFLQPRLGHQKFNCLNIAASGRPTNPDQAARLVFSTCKWTYARRVKYTVLVCKRWSDLCLENPPQQAELAVQLQNTSAPSYLAWLADSSRHAERLDITINPRIPPRGYPLLPQQSLNSLLTKLSTCSPLLRTLAISVPHDYEEIVAVEDCDYTGQGYTWDSWASSLRLLSQVENIILEVEFVPNPNTLSHGGELIQGSPVPQDIFMGLNLQVISCHRFHWL